MPFSIELIFFPILNVLFAQERLAQDANKFLTPLQPGLELYTVLEISDCFTLNVNYL